MPPRSSNARRRYSAFSLKIRTLKETFALTRLAPNAQVPTWIGGTELIAIVRTRYELSIVCNAEAVPADLPEVERGFRALGVVGTIDFGVTNVVASIAAPLAAKGIPIFNISTFDTAYVLMREEHLIDGKSALANAGYEIL
jgi:hypothetical protein